MNVKKITKDKLEKYLEKVGWSMVDHGHKHFYLYDSKGDRTDILFHGNEIKIEIFKGFTGSIVFMIERCEMKYSSRGHFVSIYPKGETDKNTVFMSFYDRRRKTPPNKE